jgi:hypothetical protein
LEDKECSVFVFHMKPQYLETIKKEIKALGNERITILTQGDDLEF